MTDDRIDFSALTPPVDALAAAIASRCEPLLAARHARATSIQIARWRRPILAASLVIAAGSALVLVLPLERGARRPHLSRSGLYGPSSRLELAQSLGVPRLLAMHLTRTTPPTLVDLLETRR